MNHSSPSPNPNDETKSTLKEVVEFAAGLTQWALAVIGGTIAALIGTDYLRPENSNIRYSYLLFIPGWIFLILAVYRGTEIHQGYLAYLFTENSEIPKDVNRTAGRQIIAIQYGLIAFGIWLEIFLIWWVFEGPQSKN